MHGKCPKLPKITSEPPLVDQVAVMLNAGNMIIPFGFRGWMEKYRNIEISFVYLYYKSFIDF